MHELGILCHVVEQVEKVAREQHLTEVEAIVLQVGELSSVVPRYLHACYPAAVDGTSLENTKLEVEILPTHAQCTTCGTVFELSEQRQVCPTCATNNFNIVDGQEFILKEIRAR